MGGEISQRIVWRVVILPDLEGQGSGEYVIPWLLDLKVEVSSSEYSEVPRIQCVLCKL